MAEKKLTARQQKFVDYFIQLGNQSEAAVRAGYSKKTSRSTAVELMAKPQVKAAIEARMSEKNKEIIADQDEILGFLTAVMRGDITEQIPLLDGDGYQKLAELDAAQPKDRLKAAELLGKRYGMWTDKKQIDANVGVVIIDDTGDDEDDED